jgi:Ca-activated chloride channel family protein
MNGYSYDLIKAKRLAGHLQRLKLSGIVVIALMTFAGLPYCQSASADAASADNGSAPVSIKPLPRRPDQTRPRSNIRLDVNLVLIPVLVTDLYDRPIRGLHKDNFRVFEGNAEQTITQFFSDDSPVSIGLIFDGSNSMTNKIGRTREATSAFLEMSTPGDEFFLVKFNDRPESVCDFTENIAEIEHGVESIQPEGWTSMYDAIYLGINKMRAAKHARKVLVVLSDGGDNNSRYTESEVRRLVKEADVRIFSISIRSGTPGLDKLTEESGGRALRVRDVDDLPDVATRLSAEIHSEYVLGYSPSDKQRDGKYRKVKVELVQPASSARLRTSWKRGYYGPTQ